VEAREVFSSPAVEMQAPLTHASAPDSLGGAGSSPQTASPWPDLPGSAPGTGASGDRWAELLPAAQPSHPAWASALDERERRRRLDEEQRGN